MNKLYQRWNSFGDWVWRLAILNLLWLITTIVGLGLITIFPATAAVFSMIRQYSQGKKVQIFQGFFKYVKKDFLKANILGYAYLLILIIMWVDYRYFLSLDNYWLVTLSIVFLIAFLFSIVAMMISYTNFAHFQLKIKDYLMNGYTFMLLHLRKTLMIIALLLLFTFFARKFPGLIPFYGISLPAYLVSWIVLPTLSPEYQLEKDRQEYKNEDVLYY